MNSQKTIVKQTDETNIDRRRSADATEGTPGPQVGESTHVEITPDRIRVRAYEIYQARNGGPGDDLSDWCQAETELNGGSTARSASGAGDADAAMVEVKSQTDGPRQPVS